MAISQKYRKGKSYRRTRGLKCRSIQGNSYQSQAVGFDLNYADDQSTAELMQHFDQLSTNLRIANQEATWLSDAINVNRVESEIAPLSHRDHKKGFVVQMVDETKKNPSKADVGVQVDESTFLVNDQRSKGTKEEPETKSEPGSENKAKANDANDECGRRRKTSKNCGETKRKCWGDEENEGNDNAATVQPPQQAVKHEDVSSCFDLKGLFKLHTLCYQLKTRVLELKVLYEKRRQLGYLYTDNEESTMDWALPCLEKGVVQLLESIENSDGHLSQLKSVVNSYRKYEAEFRALRVLSKNAKMRNRQLEFRSQRALSDRYYPNEKMNIRAIMQRYFCRPCYNTYKNSQKQ